MYLTPADIEATLKVIARRSAPASRLILNYQRPALVLHLIGLMLRRMGEPLRSAFRPEAMARLLAAHGFEVTDDRHLPEIAAVSPKTSPARSSASPTNASPSPTAVRREPVRTDDGELDRLSEGSPRPHAAVSGRLPPHSCERIMS